MSANIQQAKQKLPLPAVMHRLGLGKHAKKSARCPFHDDKHNSFSVWKNGVGLWFWKCHAGCGEGDEINFAEKHHGISNKEAMKLFLEMAGVNGAAPPARKATWTSQSTSPLDWQACVEAFTDKHVQQLAKWRGYSIEFCRWLKENRIVGLYDARIAFPVHDRVGNVVAIHHRLKDGSWRYHPQGTKTCPFVIGDLVDGQRVQCFESTWDGLDYSDKSGEQEGIIITRGAGNAKFAEAVPSTCTLYLWTQNDEAGHEWERTICAHFKGTVKRVKVPAPHKDLNDWSRAGATCEDLLQALLSAQTIREPKTDQNESDGVPEATEPRTFPLHCLPPVVRLSRELSATIFECWNRFPVAARLAL